MQEKNYIPEFQSIFKSELRDFIIYKRNCGYKYDYSMCNKFLQLDNFFIKINLSEKENK